MRRLHRPPPVFAFAATVVCLLAPVSLCEGEDPLSRQTDAMVLLKRVAETYSGLRSYQDETLLSTCTRMPFVTIEQSSRWSVSFSRPDRVAVTGGIVWVVSDGQWHWRYIAPLNRFVKKPAPAKVEPEMLSDIDEQFVSLSSAANVPVLLCHDNPLAYLTEGLRSASLVRREEQDGVECAVVEIIRRQEPPITIWAGSQDNLIRRAEIDLSESLRKTVADPATLKLATAKATLVHTGVRANAQPGKDSFRFEPYAGAREVATGKAAPEHELTGKKAPAFALKDTNGREFDSEALGGRAAAICFWRSGEPGCRLALKVLVSIHSHPAAADAAVISINCDPAEKLVTVRKEVEELGAEFPVLLDSNGAVLRSYNPKGLPSTYVLSADGRVRKVLLGYTPRLANTLLETLREATSAPEPPKR